HRFDRANAIEHSDPIRAARIRRIACQRHRDDCDEASVLLLDAQALEFLPLTGEHFAYETLPILEQTSIDLFGGGDKTKLRLREWRARAWERNTTAAIPMDSASLEPEVHGTALAFQPAASSQPTDGCTEDGADADGDAEITDTIEQLKRKRAKL